MRRPDLPGQPLYDGWQVLDPTPQELSEGAYCCGPAPVKAIHEGHTDLKYDLPFVFAEVNADWVGWKIMADGSKKKIKMNTVAVGKNISTKSVGSDSRQDITANYKYPEGTAEEREAFKEALRRINQLSEPDYSTSAPSQPHAKISVKIEEKSKPVNGKDIELVIQLLSPTPQNLLFFAYAQAMLYNSKLESNIWSEENEIQLLANEALTVPFQIPFSKYGSHLKGNNSIKVTALVADKENTDELYMAERNIVPANPPFSIFVIGEPKQFKVSAAIIKFENPLSVPLKDCRITVSGSGLLKQPVKTGVTDVQPGKKIQSQIKFTPYKRKWKKATLDCDQFKNIKTSCKVFVIPRPCHHRQ